MNLLQADGLTFGFGEQPLLQGVSASIADGEVVGLIGPNGAGKTTLLKLLANLLAPQAGAIRWDGQPPADLADRARARFLSYLPQGAPAHWPLLVERVVELGRIPHRAWWQRLAAEDQVVIAQAMTRADVEALRGRLVTTLSGGERTRVMLARVFATAPRLILADEPVASLDPFHQLQIMNCLREHGAAGGGVLVVLHDLNLAARYCDRLLLLDRGRVVCDGPTRDVLGDPALATTYAVDIEVVEDGDGPWIRFR